MPPVRSTPARRARRLHLPSRDLRFDRAAQKRRGTDDEPREGARTGDNGKEGRKSQIYPAAANVLALRDVSPRRGARAPGRTPLRRPEAGSRSRRRPHDGDRGDEPVTGDRDVGVTLRDDDESNRPPKFGQERYEFDLPENRSRRDAPVVLGTGAARDSDRLDGRTSLVVADQLGNKLLGRGGHALGGAPG